MLVKFPFFNLGFCPFLQDIAIQLGKVIWCKQHLDKWESLHSHPRACIEMDLTKSLPSSINLLGEGKFGTS